MLKHTKKHHKKKEENFKLIKCKKYIYIYNKNFDEVQQEERLSTYNTKITLKKTHNGKANKH